MVPWTYRSQHPKRHLDRFSRFCMAHKRFQPTDRPTDHATLCVARGRGATESRGSVDSPLFRVRCPHVAFDPHFLSAIPTSIPTFCYHPRPLCVAIGWRVGDAAFCQNNLDTFHYINECLTERRAPVVAEQSGNGNCESSTPVGGANFSGVSDGNSSWNTKHIISRLQRQKRGQYDKQPSSV